MEINNKIEIVEYILYKFYDKINSQENDQYITYIKLINLIFLLTRIDKDDTILKDKFIFHAYNLGVIEHTINRSSLTRFNILNGFYPIINKINKPFNIDMEYKTIIDDLIDCLYIKYPNILFETSGEISNIIHTYQCWKISYRISTTKNQLSEMISL